MNDGNIQVILNELIHIKEDIKEIKESQKDKCSTCTHVPTFRERLRSQWFHICALWTAVCGLGAYFYSHITGK